MYENRIFKRDDCNEVTCRRFRDKRNETRAMAWTSMGEINYRFKIVLIAFLLMNKIIICQTIENENLHLVPLFKNEEIEYCVGNFTNSFFIPIEDLGYKIDYIKQLTDTNIFNQLKQIKKDDWLKLLENEQSDWATTIILHYLLNESAVYYCQKESKNLEFWRKAFKKEEVSKLTKLLNEKPFREEMCCKYSYTIAYCSLDKKSKKKRIKHIMKRKGKY